MKRDDFATSDQISLDIRVAYMPWSGKEEAAWVNSSLMLAGTRAGMRGVCLVFHVLFNYKCRKLANKQRDGKGGGGTDWASFGCSHEFWADLGN